MGIYLNPGNEEFKNTINKMIYVDKSLLIEKIGTYSKAINQYICISRPRRFGKSTDANMLVAYYSKGCDSHNLFDHLKISNTKNYEIDLNQHNVIHLNMHDFLSMTNSIEDMLILLSEEVIFELTQKYPVTTSRNILSLVLSRIFSQYNESFIFIIDEWDCVFRDFKQDKEAQEKYLDFLRNLLKDKSYVKMCYMTGILPIKKYGTHSALNMFDEISMIEPRSYSEFMGFTEEEVKALCEEYNVDFTMMQYWYNGYHLKENISIYSPRSVTASIADHNFLNYWSQTETFEALKEYIDLNFDGLKENITAMMAGMKVDIDISSFQNDMTTFHSKDDVMTLLIHLGYLGYDSINQKVYIPNNEVNGTFITSVKNSNWNIVSTMLKNSKNLLEATWNLDAKKVAEYIQEVHYETSILQYNDENALSYTISLAYIAAKEFYTIIRELPTGKGYADIAFIPKMDKPAMLIELKYNHDVETGIDQIKKKNYPKGLEHYQNNLLLISISYDKTTKEHSCMIEKLG
ncbi:MAG: AAA family ATPase [Coprobacillus cateniformis]|uniref:AAA family ATPase n=1 Tax=Longibaculum muris TaxID=1796628 RepID=UPI003AB68F0F|nr:AAA family ATPase [Coprobacillus cateniformis]